LLLEILIGEMQMEISVKVESSVTSQVADPLSSLSANSNNEARYSTKQINLNPKNTPKILVKH
jgi:hypothetical protein